MSDVDDVLEWLEGEADRLEGEPAERVERAADVLREEAEP